MKYLIVNADDYGLAASVSAGIRQARTGPALGRQAHLQGIVTSTTVMMNMPDTEPALRLAAELCPNLGLGVHLNLTAGTPLLPPSQLPGLLRLGDGGRFPREPALRAAAAHLPINEVAAEWRGQIERFIHLTGKAPDHLDSHHNSSYVTYPIFRPAFRHRHAPGRWAWPRLTASWMISTATGPRWPCSPTCWTPSPTA